RLPAVGGQVLRRLLSAWICGLLTVVATILLLAEPLGTVNQLTVLTVWLVVTIALFVTYQNLRRDLVVLAILALSLVVIAIAVFSAVFLHLLGERWLLLLGVLSFL